MFTAWLIYALVLLLEKNIFNVLFSQPEKFDAAKIFFRLTSKSKVKEKQPDGTEQEVEKEFVVNRTDGIAHVGSANIDNEECYMLQKILRSLGLVYIEHQARI